MFEYIINFIRFKTYKLFNQYISIPARNRRMDVTGLSVNKLLTLFFFFLLYIIWNCATIGQLSNRPRVSRDFPLSLSPASDSVTNTFTNYVITITKFKICLQEHNILLIWLNVFFCQWVHILCIQPTVIGDQINVSIQFLSP